MFVRCCALNVVNTLTESVNAIPDGRARNVPCGMMSAKYPTVMDMVIVLAGSANASEDTKGNTAKKVSPFLSTLEIFTFKIVSFFFNQNLPSIFASAEMQLLIFT